jgi:hypothetical protein
LGQARVKETGDVVPPESIAKASVARSGKSSHDSSHPSVVKEIGRPLCIRKSFNKLAHRILYGLTENRWPRSGVSSNTAGTTTVGDEPRLERTEVRRGGVTEAR